MRTADQIEEINAAKTAEISGLSGKPKRKMPKGRPFQKGVSGNPGGRPKHDIAKEIAQLVFTENKEAIYDAMTAGLLSGSAYVFKELAERGFGKLKEYKEVSHIYENESERDLNERITQLERDLGLAGQIDEIGRTEGSQGRDQETGIATQDTNLLPR